MTDVNTLNILIHEYLTKRLYTRTGNTFKMEGSVPEYTINAKNTSLLEEWFKAFNEVWAVRCGDISGYATVARIESVLLKLENEKKRHLLCWSGSAAIDETNMSGVDNYNLTQSGPLGDLNKSYGNRSFSCGQPDQFLDAKYKEDNGNEYNMYDNDRSCAQPNNDNPYWNTKRSVPGAFYNDGTNMYGGVINEDTRRISSKGNLPPGENDIFDSSKGKFPEYEQFNSQYSNMRYMENGESSSMPGNAKVYIDNVTMQGLDRTGSKNFLDSMQVQGMNKIDSKNSFDNSNVYGNANRIDSENSFENASITGNNRMDSQNIYDNANSHGTNSANMQNLYQQKNMHNAFQKDGVGNRLSVNAVDKDSYGNSKTMRNINSKMSGDRFNMENEDQLGFKNALKNNKAKDLHEKQYSRRNTLENMDMYDTMKKMHYKGDNTGYPQQIENTNANENIGNIMYNTANSLSQSNNFDEEINKGNNLSRNKNINDDSNKLNRNSSKDFSIKGHDHMKEYTNSYNSPFVNNQNYNTDNINKLNNAYKYVDKSNQPFHNYNYAMTDEYSDNPNKMVQSAMDKYQQNQKENDYFNSFDIKRHSISQINELNAYNSEIGKDQYTGSKNYGTFDNSNSIYEYNTKDSLHEYSRNLQDCSQQQNKNYDTEKKQYEMPLNSDVGKEMYDLQLANDMNYDNKNLFRYNGNYNHLDYGAENYSENRDFMQSIASFNLHSSKITCMDVSHPNNLIFTSGNDNILSILCFKTLKILISMDLKSAPNNLKIKELQNKQNISPDQKEVNEEPNEILIALSFSDGKIISYIYNIAQNQLHTNIKLQIDMQSNITSFVFSDNSIIASNLEGNICEYNFNGKIINQTRVKNLKSILKCDGNMLLISDRDKVFLYDFNTKQHKATLINEGAEILYKKEIYKNQNGSQDKYYYASERYYIICCKDKFILYNSSFTPIEKLNINEKILSCCLLNDMSIILGCYQIALRIQNGNIQELKAHENNITKIESSFCNNKEIVITCGYKGTCKIWETGV